MNKKLDLTCRRTDEGDYSCKINSKKDNKECTWKKETKFGTSPSANFVRSCPIEKPIDIIKKW